MESVNTKVAKTAVKTCGTLIW